MFVSSNKLDTWNDMNIIQFTSPATSNENLWENIKGFFNPHNSMIILAIICLLFFLITLCLVFIIFQLLKKKPKPHPKFDFPSSPFQLGLTSNQIISPSTIESNKTQSFDTFQKELKPTWNEKGNDDDIETVNEVLGMEERNGKVYYKVNFTGHPSDYTAWVCEEDLIPE